MPDFSEMSDSAKAGTFAAGGGGVTGGVLALVGGGLDGWKIVLVALLVFGAFFLIFWLFLRSIDRGRKNRLKRAVADDADHAPAGASQQERDNLAHLRNQLKKGFEKVQNQPWYLVMGASGSGKSFALRKSGLDWGGGDTNTKQGVGGTRTMDWWISDEAVFLDTAGRYVDALIEDGSDESDDQIEARLNQLKEFLRLIKKHKPHIPINGLVLVVSAVDLKTKSPDDLKEDSRKIIRTLKKVQESLDLRIPVIVWVTKCDKIAGFRNYFSGIAGEPVLRQQMMGWSAPGGTEALDDRFPADQLGEHLLGVVDELKARRWSLLDSINLDSGQNRADAASSLYIFPDQFAEVIEPLQQYLSTIFGQASDKPPFFRGIYFTSAITEGEELDRRIAEAQRKALGDLVAEEREGRRRGPGSYTHDRPFFIKESLTKKLFLEKGLVSRYSDAVAGMRRAQWLVAAAMACALIVMGLWVWFMAENLKTTISNEAELWAHMAKGTTDPSSVAILARKEEGGFKYRGDAPIPNRHTGDTILSSYEQLSRMSQTNLGVSLLFKIFPKKEIDSKDRRLAWRKMFSNYGCKPIFEFTDEAMRSLTNWNTDRVLPAIQALVNWQAAQGNHPSPFSSQTNILAPLVRLLIHPQDPSGQELATLDRLFRQLVEWEGGSVSNLPSQGKSLDSNPGIKNALNQLNSETQNQIEGVPVRLDRYRRLTNSMKSLREAEAELANWNNPKVINFGRPDDAVKDLEKLQGLYENYLSRHAEFKRDLEQLVENSSSGRATPLAKFQDESGDIRTQCLSILAHARDALSGGSSTNDLLGGCQRFVNQAYVVGQTNLDRHLGDTKRGLEEHEVFHFGSRDNNGLAKYQQRFGLYSGVLRLYGDTPAFPSQIPTNTAGQLRATIGSYPLEEKEKDDKTFQDAMSEILDGALAYHANRIQRILGGQAKELIAKYAKFPIVHPSKSEGELSVSQVREFLTKASAMREKLQDARMPEAKGVLAEVKELEAVAKSLLSEDMQTGRIFEVSLVKITEASKSGRFKYPFSAETSWRMVRINDGLPWRDKLDTGSQIPWSLSISDPQLKVEEAERVANQAANPRDVVNKNGGWQLLRFLLQRDPNTDVAKVTTNEWWIMLKHSPKGPFVLSIKSKQPFDLSDWSKAIDSK